MLGVGWVQETCTRDRTRDDKAGHGSQAPSRRNSTFSSVSRPGRRQETRRDRARAEAGSPPPAPGPARRRKSGSPCQMPLGSRLFQRAVDDGDQEQWLRERAVHKRLPANHLAGECTNCSFTSCRTLSTASAVGFYRRALPARLLCSTVENFSAPAIMCSANAVSLKSVKNACVADDVCK